MPDILTILDDVQTEGMAACLRYTERFDHRVLDASEVLMNPLATRPGRPALEIREAIDYAIERVKRFHQAVRPTNVQLPDAFGVELAEQWIPFDRVGVYVPNGRFPLVSSLMMTAIPALEAGVKQIVVAIPPKGALDDVWLYVLQRLGISQVVRLGGAQAVGAFAYGIEGLLPVDFIAGPGNRYVTEAKMEVQRRGVVGVDGYAGPSEVMVIANQMKLADLVWGDLAAQAEHDPLATGDLVTTNRELAGWVRRRADDLPAGMGTISVHHVASLAEARDLANRRAPEHLGLMGDDVEGLAGEIRTAGALFVGAMAGQALGDYVAGPSHVLPTGGRGRFQSGLTTRSFCRRMSVIQAHDNIDPKLLEMGMRLAELEGLSQHRESLAARLRTLESGEEASDGTHR